jgi:RNA polymerase sigma factor (sigma-70 family)
LPPSRLFYDEVSIEVEVIMNESGLVSLIHRLRKLSITDSELKNGSECLRRFVEDGDESSFTILVHLYSRLVWNVCWQELRQVQDAEDAFQNVFLLLARHAASIRKGQSLTSWLYRVSRRVAQKASMDRSRREVHEQATPSSPNRTLNDNLSWQELQSVLEEELERLPEKYRLPFLLCCIEGNTGSQAAKKLGWKEGTVTGRLSQARKLLQKRLLERCISLSMVLAAWDLSSQIASAILEINTLQAVFHSLSKNNSSEGAIAYTLADFPEGGPKTMMSIKAKCILGVLLTGSLIYLSIHYFRPAMAAEQEAKSSLLARAAEEQVNKADAKDEDTIEVKGVVLGPDKKPIKGAEILRVKGDKYAKEQVTGEDGKFSFTLSKKELDPEGYSKSSWVWTKVIARAEGYGIAWCDLGKRNKEGNLTLQLVKDDLSLSGRLLDDNGKPVVGAAVSVGMITIIPERELPIFVQMWKVQPLSALSGSVQIPSASHEWDRLWYPWKVGLFAPTKTDEKGRFSIKGLGNDRIVNLLIQGDKVAQEEIHIVMQKEIDKDVNEPPPAFKEENQKGRLRLYGASFEHSIEASKPIKGVLTDKQSGKPLAGIHLVATAHGRTYWFDVETISDDKGQYTLMGLPKNETYNVLAYQKPNDPKPTHIAIFEQLKDTEGFEPIKADIPMERGVLVEGKMIDKETGKPVPGRVSYQSLLEQEKNIRSVANQMKARHSNTVFVGSNGSFQMVIPRSKGAILAQSDSRNYLPAKEAELLEAFGRQALFSLPNAYEMVNPDAKTETLKIQFELRPKK